jgi:hypothetical protein
VNSEQLYCLLFEQAHQIDQLTRLGMAAIILLNEAEKASPLFAAEWQHELQRLKDWRVCTDDLNSGEVVR